MAAYLTRLWQFVWLVLYHSLCYITACGGKSWGEWYTQGWYIMLFIRGYIFDIFMHVRAKRMAISQYHL